MKDVDDLTVQFGEVLSFTHNSLQALYLIVINITRPHSMGYKMKMLSTQRGLLLDIINNLKTERLYLMGGDLDRLIPGDNKQNADIVCSAVRAYLSAPESDIKKKARADGRMIAKTPIAAIRGLYDYRANGLRPPVEVVGRAAAGAGAAPAASPAPAAALSAGDAAAGAGAGAPAAFPVPRAVASRASRTGNSYLLPSSSFPAGSSRSGAHFVRGGKRKSKTIRKHKSKRHTKRKRNQK